MLREVWVAGGGAEGGDGLRSVISTGAKFGSSVFHRLQAATQKCVNMRNIFFSGSSTAAARFKQSGTAGNRETGDELLDVEN